MWISHLAFPSLFLKPFFPNVPLVATAFSGAAPDFVFYLLALCGIREGRWELTHSAAGVGMWALFVAGLSGLVHAGFKSQARARVVPAEIVQTMLAIGLALGSHWFLDLLAHRPRDILNPFSIESVPRFSMYDYPFLLFLVDSSIAIGALTWYARPLNNVYIQQGTKLALGSLFALVQAGFCFYNLKGVRAPHREIMDTRTGDTHTIYLGEKSGGRGTIHNLFQMMEIMLGSLAIWFFLEPTKARSREVDFKEKVKWMVKEGVSKMRGRRLPQQERTSVELPRPAAEESIAVSGADMKTDHLRLSQEELRHDGEKRGYTRHVHLGRSLDETL